MTNPELEMRVRELETALAHARRIADAERSRAALAEASAKRAWQLATWPAPRRSSDGADHAAQ